MQETFDRTATHLFEQGEQSLDPVTQRCAYRGNKNMKCAAGIWIPDESYNPAFEGVGVYGLKDCEVNFTTPHLELLLSLQHIHDEDANWISTDRMRSKLGSVAASYGLNASKLDTLSFKDR